MSGQTEPKGFQAWRGEVQVFARSHPDFGSGIKLFDTLLALSEPQFEQLFEHRIKTARRRRNFAVSERILQLGQLYAKENKRDELLVICLRISGLCDRVFIASRPRVNFGTDELIAERNARETGMEQGLNGLTRHSNLGFQLDGLRTDGVGKGIVLAVKRAFSTLQPKELALFWSSPSGLRSVHGDSLVHELNELNEDVERGDLERMDLTLSAIKLTAASLRFAS
ncbi:hypothetical protein JCM10212_006737 [Sporobolomyces blumeae]